MQNDVDVDVDERESQPFSPIFIKLKLTYNHTLRVKEGL